MESVMKVLFLTLSISVLISAQWVYDDDGCRTPGGGVGNCVIYKDCPSIINYRQQFKELTQIQKKFLNGYRCGYSENIVKVCCPRTLPIPLEIRYNKVDLLPYECGISDVQNKLINGDKASLNEFPWMALLFYSTNKGPTFQCGGTIINERYILTAAHCVNKQLLFVRVGEHNITSALDCETDEFNIRRCSLPSQDIKIEKVTPHEKFFYSTAENDIALIRLAKPLNIQTENVKAICLPLRNSSVTIRKATHSHLLITGWGITETDFTSDVLLKGIVPMATPEMCNNTYAKYHLNISDKQFCIGGVGNTTDSCRGDSGGPLQHQEYLNDDVRYTQLGIVSVGPKNCGLKGLPSLNTRVDQYLDWILENIEP